MSGGLRVLLVCSGLDHAHRGYESFARECFAALRDEPELELELVKGSGASRAGERVAWTLRRDRLAAQGLGRALDARPFRVEAFAFGFGLQPLLRRYRPDVVYLSEWDTAKVLARSRALTGQRFKILFSNGGFAASGFEHLDHVQELTPAGRDYVLARGADPARHTVLPLGFSIDAQLLPTNSAERTHLRRRLRLPAEVPILICVAALNRTHKRLDYLIEELAGLPEPRPFLLMVGQPEEETPAVRSLARQRLGEHGHEIRTVTSAEVPGLLRASDAFVLASLLEAQSRALIEAVSQGVNCIVHDSPVTRYGAADSAFFGDFGPPGGLKQAVERWLAADRETLGAQARAGHANAYERFSWDRLRPRYVELLAGVAYKTVSSSRGE